MNIGIIGTGAYAIALASILEQKDINILMWTKIKEEYEELKNNHTNLKVLNYKLNNKVEFTNNLEELSNKSDAIIISIQTRFVKNTILELKKYYNNQPILIATKGMILDDYLLIHDFLKKELNTKSIDCISGPTFAKDVILKQPIGLTLTNNNDIFYKIFSNVNYVTIELNNDIIGIELCGILKNIIAISSGILYGMNLNTSTISKFLIDTSREIQEIIKKCNGNPNTFYTYAGIGDYLLTTTSINSRNFTFGLLIGQDKDYLEYQEKTTIEGLENLTCLYNFLKRKNIHYPLINILYDIIYNNIDKNILIDYINKKSQK